MKRKKQAKAASSKKSRTKRAPKSKPAGKPQTGGTPEKARAATDAQQRPGPQTRALPGPTASTRALPKADAPERGLSARQERFCQLYASGKTATEAYRQTYNNTHSAEAASSRLLSCVKVKERVTALQTEAARGAVLSLQESLEYLRRGVLTPLGDIDERNDLCQSAEYLVNGGVRGKLRRGNAESGNEEEEPETTTVKIKMVDKLKALELNARLQGFLIDKHEHQHGADNGLLELLARISG